MHDTWMTCEVLDIENNLFQKVKLMTLTVQHDDVALKAFKASMSKGLDACLGIAQTLTRPVREIAILEISG